MDTTIEQLIGQLFAVGFYGTTPSSEIVELIQRYHVGSVILFSRNVQSGQQVTELTQQLQEIARAAGQRYPLLIMIDQENGMVRRLGDEMTMLPGNMALGAIENEQVAYDVAEATGRELRTFGINMNLAPVADVNNNPANPVIGVRSFGEDPQLVARLTAAAVRGYRAAGVISTLKHFPGHGDTAVDSHLSLPTIPYDMKRLEELELIPFKSGITADADCVMTAHLYLPQLMTNEVLPATVSPVILRTLLREKLGFKGVVISDCLVMKAVSELIGEARGSIMALQAGVDLVLISHYFERQSKSIEAVQKAVRAGEISLEMIQQAGERIRQLKARTLLWEEQLHAITLSSTEYQVHQQLRDKAYALSTTLVKNEDGLVPLQLRGEQHLLVIAPQRSVFTEVEDRKDSEASLVEYIRRYHEQVTALPSVRRLTSTQREEMLQAAKEADIILVLTVNARLDQQQIDFMHDLLQLGRPVIGVAVGAPYDVEAFPNLGTYFATYEYTPPALKAMADVLFGKSTPQGKLPVSLTLSGHYGHE